MGNGLCADLVLLCLRARQEPALEPDFAVAGKDNDPGNGHCSRSRSSKNCVAEMNSSVENLSGAGDKADASETRTKNFNYALVKECDMLEELRVEAVDMCVTAVERHPGNYEVKAIHTHTY